MHDLHEGPVVVASHMFEHADGYDAIEFSLQFAVVHPFDGHIQPAAVLPGESNLFPRNGYPEDSGVVFFGRSSRITTPAAADIQNRHSGLQSDFAADERQLGFLGLVQGIGFFPESA